MGDSGERKLGIPTVLDRFIQQAILQVLQPLWDSTFSDQSYGFRSGRSAHQAVAKAQEYIAQGKAVVVDMGESPRGPTYVDNASRFFAETKM